MCRKKLVVNFELVKLGIGIGDRRRSEIGVEQRRIEPKEKRRR